MNNPSLRGEAKRDELRRIKACSWTTKLCQCRRICVWYEAAWAGVRRSRMPLAKGVRQSTASGSLSNGRLASKFVCIFFSTTTSGRLPLTITYILPFIPQRAAVDHLQRSSILWAQSVVTCIRRKLWASGSHSSGDHTSEVQQIHMSLSSRVAARSTC